jgi:hypothetical protein
MKIESKKKWVRKEVSMGIKLSAIVLILIAASLGGWAYYRQSQIEHGQQAFKRLGCGDCHFAGGAPNLSTVTKRYDRTTLVRFIQDPETIYRERGKRPLNANYFPMPDPHASPADAKSIVAYLASLSK